MASSFDLRSFLGVRTPTLSGTERTRSRFGPAQAPRVNGIEFVPFHGADEIDVRLMRRVRRLGLSRVENDVRVRLRRSPSD